ncbi:UNVERIFIED_CONTAM: hypothetical protein RMT77_003352 [Armadillidium vulgare]
MVSKTRVNAATLPKYNGRPVILIGQVGQIDSTGQNVQIKTSDEQLVVVRLNEPLKENLEGIVEFHGTGHGQQMLADFYVSFPGEYAQNFDIGMYNDAVTFIHTVDNNPWCFD